MDVSRILVIDSDDELCESLDLLWASYGLTVHTCRNTREGGKIARSSGVDACLIERGKDAARFVAEVRDLGAGIVLLTGAPLGDSDATDAAREAGADGYEGKPFEAMAVLRRIRALAKS